MVIFEIMITSSASFCVASSLNSILARASVNLEKRDFFGQLGQDYSKPDERLQLPCSDWCCFCLRLCSKFQVEILEHLYHAIGGSMF